MTISRVARKTTGKGFFETLNVDDLFEEQKKGRWCSKISKNYFTIYEGIEVGDTKKTLYSSMYRSSNHISQIQESHSLVFKVWKQKAFHL
jgi:hypothetical protein